MLIDRISFDDCSDLDDAKKNAEIAAQIARRTARLGKTFRQDKLVCASARAKVREQMLINFRLIRSSNLLAKLFADVGIFRRVRFKAMSVTQAR
jgi:hypothetical protein